LALEMSRSVGIAYILFYLAVIGVGAFVLPRYPRVWSNSGARRSIQASMAALSFIFVGMMFALAFR
jgi:hypothetical protein